MHVDGRSEFDEILLILIKIKIIFICHTQLHREYTTSSEMYSVHLTHPK